MIFRKNSLISLVLIISFAITVFFSPAILAQEYELRITNPDAPYVSIGDMRYPYYVYGMMRSFGQKLEALSGGRIETEVYPDGTLGDLRANMESVKVGALQATTPSEGPVSIWYPEIQVLTIPYIFPNEAVAWEVLDGPFGQKLFDGLIGEGFRVVSAGSNGTYRFWGNNVRPIESPADMNDLNIRTMEIASHQAMVESLGANPTSVAWTEVYSALQTGVVDGAELPTVGALQQNLHEVLDYITVDNHLYSLSFIIVSEQWYQTLPEDLQTQVNIAGEIAQTTSRGLAQAQVNDVMAEFEERGVEVNYISPEMQQEFANIAQPAVIEWMEEEVGEELVKEFLQAVEDAEEKLGM